MTFRPAPLIENRTSDEIRAEIYRRLALARAGQGGEPLEERGSVEALVQVFGRYWDIVAARLNTALDKHFLAYLNYLGVVPVPATSARGPLTFFPVPTMPSGARVPERTQVAAAPAEGESEPVVFETTAPLQLTTAKLTQVFSLEPARNLQHDMRLVAKAESASPLPVFGVGDPADHDVFIGDSTLFAQDDITTVTVRFDLEGGPPAAESTRRIEWSIVTDADPIVLVPSSDTTRALRESGEVVFERPKAWPAAKSFGRESRWLAGRLTGIGRGNWSLLARRIELRAEVTRQGLQFENATGDSGAPDLTKDFYPFGLRPTFGSTMYFASAEAFSRPGTRVTLDVHLTNPHDAAEDPPIPRVNTNGHPRVWWEYWNGSRWTRLDATDSTLAFRANGTVSFQTPHDIAATDIQGQHRFWVRARLVSGNYGEDVRFDFDSPEQGAGMRYRAGTLAPPSIQSIAVSYTLAIVTRPEVVVTVNERVHEDRSVATRTGMPFTLFGFPCGGRSGLYLAFAVAPATGFAGKQLNLYVLAETAGTPFSRTQTVAVPQHLRWQFWNGAAWQDMHVRDETGGLTREGTLSLQVPEEARERADVVERIPLFWFRVIDCGEPDTWLPAIRAMLLNTVLAEHRTTIQNEVLGSSHGEPSHQFKLLRAPVLQGEVLQVAEPISPAELSHRRRTDELPSGQAVQLDDEHDGADRGGLWVRWQGVDNLGESAPDDRHYQIDRLTGDVTFGDGRHGRIPPVGMNNIRVQQYQTGGGASGNKPARSVGQLRSSVPYVAAVANLVETSGGADVEPLGRVRERGATAVRHRSRAVTMEDYEDLARLASPQVARADCIPLRDLTQPPVSRTHQPGMVSVIVVPRSASRVPIPDGELLRRVGAYLDSCRNVSSGLVVVAPEYVEVGVRAQLAVSDLREADAIAARVTAAIDGFLHPISGGPARSGWRPGQRPERRDLYAICASTPGVLYVTGLTVAMSEPRPGVLAARHFLVAAGEQHISVRYLPADGGVPLDAGAATIGASDVD